MYYCGLKVEMRRIIAQLYCIAIALLLSWWSCYQGKCRLHPLEQLSPNTDEIKLLNLDLIFANVN